MSIDVRHCFYCEKCIKEFDHHCYWVDNCIGGENINVFIAFLTFLALNLIGTALICSYGNFSNFN